MFVGVAKATSKTTSFEQNPVKNGNPTRAKEPISQNCNSRRVDYWPQQAN